MNGYAGGVTSNLNVGALVAWLASWWAHWLGFEMVAAMVVWLASWWVPWMAH